MANSKQIVYLSQAQYAELIANGSITVDGVTVQYDENDIYVTPQAEPVTDVRINGTSIAANGVANIPLATSNQLGVFKVGGGLLSRSDGTVVVHGAAGGDFMIGANTTNPIVPAHQHESVFFGLAKASGDATQSQSSNEVGTYTPEAKGAIQSMLGVSDLIATAENNLVASKAYKVGDVFTANGKLYKATAAITADAAIIPAVEGEEIAGANCIETNISENFIKNTDYASETSNGVVRIKDSYGVGTILSYNINTGATEKYTGIISASSDKIKNGTELYNPIIPYRQHESVFYGLAKAAGDTTQKASENTVGSYTDEAKSAIRGMLGAIGDVQVNGTSVISNGVANVPVASNTDYGVVKVQPYNGLEQNFAGYLQTAEASSAEIKSGTAHFKPIVPVTQEKSVFYGLAKAAGDTTQSQSNNTVGIYTNEAKIAIQEMIGIPGSVDVTISGTDPIVTAVANHRYICGEVYTLNFTPSATGICDIIFTSGSTATVLTLPSTVRMPEWFDITTLQTDTIYEINIVDGVYGAVMSWPVV